MNQNPPPPLFDDAQLLTPSAQRELLRHASVLACECPKHLVDILTRVREFQAYQQRCIHRSEADRETHEWLYQAGINLDQQLSATIVELARREGMLDAENRIARHPHRRS